MENSPKDYKTQGYRAWHFWRMAAELRKTIYEVTKGFPHSEVRRVSQMNSAARSIKQNIQEGYRRRSRMELARFLEYPKARPKNFSAIWRIASKTD